MNKALVLLALLAIGFAASTERVEHNNAADALVDEVSRMEGEIHQEQQNHDELYATQSAECVAEFWFRTSEISNADTAFEAATAASSRCAAASAASSADLERARGYVAAINDILSGLAAQRAAENASFNTLVNDELLPAIAAVEGAYPILKQFASQASSFVQFNDHMNKMFTKIVKAKKVNQFSAIVATLLQSPDFQHGISGSVIAQLEQLFDELLADLNEAHDFAVETENAAVAVYVQTVAEYNAILANLEVTISSLVVYISELDTCVSNENQIASEAGAKSRRNAEALSHAVEMCTAFDAEYENSTNARNEELALLGKLKVFVREQEDIFGNFGNDGVNSFEEYKKTFQIQRKVSQKNFVQAKLRESKLNKKPVVQAKKCDSCQKSFVQKKLGF